MDLKKLELPGLELVDDNADYNESQLFYIDFDGASNVSYNNNALNINIENITIEDSGLSSLEQTQIISQLNEFFADTGISFTATAPTAGEFSTIFVGGNSDVFSDLGSFAGLSETIDAGNEIKDDNAFVFVSDTKSVISTIVHEAGHLVGYKHVAGNTNSIYDFAEATVTPISVYGAYSMVTDAINAVDSRLAVAASVEDSIKIFSIQDHENGLYFRNSYVWTGDVDLTCISPWNSDGGKNKAGTLITPQHIVFAAHYKIAVGSTIRFVTQDDEVIERKLVGYTVAPEYSPHWPDYVIGVLEEIPESDTGNAVPDSITSTYYLPDNFDAYLNQYVSSYQIPAFVLDQEEKALITNVSGLAEGSNMASYTYPTGDRYDYYEDQIGGDSGDPGFLIIDGKLVLLEVRTYGGPGSGTSQTLMKHSIQDIINVDNQTYGTDYTLQIIDTSHFTTYEQETGYLPVLSANSAKTAGVEVITSNEVGAQSFGKDTIIASTGSISINDELKGVSFNADGCEFTVNGLIDYVTNLSGNLYGVYYAGNSGSFTVGETGSINLSSLSSGSSSKFLGVYSYNGLTTDGIAGDFTINSDAGSVYGIASVLLDFSGGDISGDISVTKNVVYSGTFYDKLYTYGLFSLSDLYTADISGGITVNGVVENQTDDRYDRGNSLTRAIYAQGNMVIQEISGNILGSSDVSGDNNAYADSYGLYALGSTSIGVVTGVVSADSYSETGEAYSRAIHANGDLTITEISGTVAAYAAAGTWSNVAMANAVRGDAVSGVDGAALVIAEDAVVAAYVIGNSSSVANAIVATGGMNLDIYGTVSATGTNENGTYRSLYAYGDADDSIVLRYTAAITGDIVLAGGDDSLTLETGLILEADIDFGDGDDTMTVCGDSDGFGSAAITGDVTYDGSLTVDFDIVGTSALSTLLSIFSSGFGDGFSLQVDNRNQDIGVYSLISSAEDITSFYSGQTFLINDTAELVVGGGSVAFGTRLYELEVSASTELVLTVADYDSEAPTTPLGLTSTIYNETATVVLDWNDSSDIITSGEDGVVTGYVVEYSQMFDFSESFTVSTSVSELSVEDLADGTWYWRVMAVDLATNVSDWSVTAQFAVDFPDIKAPDVPVDLIQVVDDKDVFLDWSDSADNKSGLKEYVVEYSFFADFSNAEEITVTDSELSLADLGGGYYYWRVKAVDEAGNVSDWNSSAFAIFPDGQEKIVPEGVSEDSFFGQNVAISGDTFVVGSGFDGQGDAANIVYVFSWNDITQSWDDIEISVSDVQSSWSNYLDISGDVIVVGDKGDDSSGVSGGAVHVYQWNGTVWQETVLTASDAQAGDQFGWSTAVDGERIIVGARYDDDSGTDAGSAYIYEWNGSGWDETKLLASDGTAIDAFGSSVAISGDRAVVGARYGDVLGNSTGGAYVYSWNEGSWEETKLTASDASEDDYFGGSVAIDGDIIVVGASGDDDNGENSGSAYIYRWNGEDWIETKLTASDGQANDRFGWSVTVADGDTDTVIIGSYGFDCTGPDSGCAYLFQWNGSIWVESKFSAVDVQAGDNFGWSLDIDGNTIIAGARKDNAAGEDSGSAHVFELDTVIDSTPPTAPSALLDVVLGDEVSLTWNASYDLGGSGISKYVLQYADNASFVNATELDLTDNGLVLTGLSNDTWYWRVQAVDVASNISDWSDVDSFAVDIQTLDALTGLTVAVSGDDISLDWDNAQGVVYGVKNYIIEYARDAVFSNAIQKTSSVSSFNIANIAEGDWFWRVRVEDNNAGFSAWTQGEDFFVDVSAPSVPIILSDDVDADSVVLDWSSSTDSGVGLSGYVVQYADNSDFVNAFENTSTSSELSLDGLGDGVYYWRVKSFDGNGNDSAWSDESSFIVDTIAPSAPTGLFDYLEGNDVSLTWYAASDTYGGSGVMEYVVEYAGNSNFASAVEMVVDTNQLQLDNVAYGTYYWRVRAVDYSGNQSSWSVSDRFVMNDTVGDSFAEAEVIDLAETYTKTEYVGIGDAYDYYTFELSNAGSFDIVLSDLSDKAFVSVYQLDYTNRGLAYRRIAGSGSAPDKLTGELSAVIDNLLLDAGTYYIEITSGDKGAGRINADYTLEIVPDYLPAPDNNEFNFKTGEGTPDDSLILDVVSGAGASGWVGFGDAQDVYVFDVDSAGEFNIALTGLDAKTRLTLYREDELNGIVKYKKISSINSKDDSAFLDNLLLNDGTYYIEILSGDNGRGRFNTDYELDVAGDLLPEYTDNNSWADATTVGLGSIDGYVGFGDAVDYYKFDVGALDVFDFELTGDDKDAKLTIYEWDYSKDKFKKVAAASLKNGEAMLDNISLDAGLYYVEVLSKDKGKGKFNTEYELNIATA